METAEGAFRSFSLIHDLSELPKLHVEQPRALGYSYILPARSPVFDWTESYSGRMHGEMMCRLHKVKRRELQ